MRSPLQPRVARPLQLRRELSCVGIAAAGILVTFFAAWAVGPIAPDASLEWRAAWVLACAGALPIGAWSAQNEDERLRALPLGLAIVPLAHLVLPWSALVATADVVVALGAAAVVLGRAVIRLGTRRHGSAPRTRLVSCALLVLALPGPLFTLGWGLASSIAIPGVVRAFHQSPVLFLPDERFVEVETDDHLTLRGGYTPGTSGAAVLLVHGYSDSRRRMEVWADVFSGHGAHVLRLDNRGAGVSDGTVVTFAEREARDVAGALDWLAEQPGVDRARLYAVGASMGGGAVLASLALGDRLAAFAALCPASDYPALVLRNVPPEPIATVVRAMIWGVPRAMGHASPLSMRPGRALDRSRVPGIVVHSRADRTIPPEVTEALVAAHPELEVVWLDGPSHDDTPRAAANDPVARGAVLRRFGLDD